MLMILDGCGIRQQRENNAIAMAKTPNLDALKARYAHTQLRCSGEAVGLPEGIMGNSEVGHLNIGAGRIVYQDLMRINVAIRDRSFFENPVLKATLQTIHATKGSRLHLMGLVSNGGVHSDIQHLFALLEMARQNSIQQVFVHVILDGRDTPPDSGIGFVKQLKEHICKHNYGDIASICGRYYAMDRDKRWDRIEKAYRLYTQGIGTPETDPIEAVQKAYGRGETDEFVTPIAVVDKGGHPIGAIQDGDGVIFFNFRADRAREISTALALPDAGVIPFDRSSRPALSTYVCMTQYDEHFPFPVAFGPVHLVDILGEMVSRQGIRQLRIAETEKYAHVTYFFNGGEEKPFDLEDRCLIPSPRDVPTYDFKPEMSALAVTEEVLKRLESRQYGLVVLNFANMDMVGHTGILSAAIRAVETVDGCIGRIADCIRSMGGVLMVTADHGNAETMVDENGTPHTAHTLNPVPFILVDETRIGAKLREGILADIAPTILQVMGIDQPSAMTGKSLLLP
jgi:2,3-bisphosphoglycerate-independent phosphoglycerate mutase